MSGRNYISAEGGSWRVQKGVGVHQEGFGAGGLALTKKFWRDNTLLTMIEFFENNSPPRPL